MIEAVQYSLFYQLAALLLLAGVLGFIAIKLRQPLIVAFIALGLLVGPDALGLVDSGVHLIETLAQLGVTLLLFMVGLKLDISLIRTLGGVALATGLGQVLFTALFGFLICLGFNLGVVPSLYVAVALTFSSTIIVVKLLSDKQEIDSLHGRIALGFLIVQDVFVVLCMVALSAFGIGESSDSLFAELGMVVLKGAALVGFVLVFIYKFANPLMNFAIHSQELMVVFALAAAASLAALADYLGFSIELGGLLAGVALASTPLRDVLYARLSSLRDFLLLFFFVALGTQIDLDILGRQITPALVLSVFVLVGNPLIVMVIMGSMGYRKRTGFLAGLTVAQISEFSLIFMAMGISLGHVDENMLGLVTLVGLITISLSTYMISYSQFLYQWLEPFLDVFEKKNPYREQAKRAENETRKYDVILFGLGRYGLEIAEEFLKKDITVLGMDFDPGAIRKAASLIKNEGFSAVYGDVTDPDFAHGIPLNDAKWVICAVPHHYSTLQEQNFRVSLPKNLRLAGYKGKVATVSHSKNETRELILNGADIVLTPFSDAARQAVSLVIDADGLSPPAPHGETKDRK